MSHQMITFHSTHMHSSPKGVQSSSNHKTGVQLPVLPGRALYTALHLYDQAFSRIARQHGTAPVKLLRNLFLDIWTKMVQHEDVAYISAISRSSPYLLISLILLTWNILFTTIGVGTSEGSNIWISLWHFPPFWVSQFWS